MSRSYREPVYVDGYGSTSKRFKKNYANRRIRRTTDVIANGNAYRRFTDPWDICDYRFRWDPWPRYYWHNGELKERTQDPYWKAIRK